MLKVKRQYAISEFVRLPDDEALSIRAPTNDVVKLWVLNPFILALLTLTIS